MKLNRILGVFLLTSPFMGIFLVSCFKTSLGFRGTAIAFLISFGIVGIGFLGTYFLSR